MSQKRRTPVAPVQLAQPPPRSRTPTALWTLGWLLAALACSAPQDAGHTELVVFAASSLTDAFTALAADFEQAHPGVVVRLTFGGSQALRLQVEQGAPADLFASADPAHVEALSRAGQLGEHHVFASNELTVIVPRAAPFDGRDPIRSFGELARAERLVVGSEGVPLGRYTAVLLDGTAAALGPDFRDAVRAGIVSREGNARLVRAKVELGEADAAVVYRSDARGSARVREVPIPAELNVRAAYAVAPLERSHASALAAAFVTHLTSAAGQHTLRAHGFLDPP